MYDMTYRCRGKTGGHDHKEPQKGESEENRPGGLVIDGKIVGEINGKRATQRHARREGKELRSFVWEDFD